MFSKYQQDHKRLLILKSGQVNGRYVEPREETTSHNCVAICEGLITGLSIALFWKGPIYVALTAGNLRHVRHCLVQQGDGAVYFFVDNDQWKPHVGNVGL